MSDLYPFCVLRERPVPRVRDVDRFRAGVLLDAGGRRSTSPGACANSQVALCNWVVPASSTGSLCRSCSADPHPSARRRRPRSTSASSRPRRPNGGWWRSSIDLGLPIVPFTEHPEGLAFDLLSSRFDEVMIGHEDGLITLDLAETDDAHRERVRMELGEAYRTVLGHFRHEVGHYYWMVLVRDAGRLDEFRERFGDERVDYGDALSSHYGGSGPTGWENDHVSAYATMHPWEDWAETFAHYLHLRDTLQTAAETGVRVADPEGWTGGGGRRGCRPRPLRRGRAGVDRAGRRPQRPQPLDGRARPLPVRAGAPGHRQARLRRLPRPRP